MALPLSIGAAARSAFVKYKFTDKRVSVKTDAPWESEWLPLVGLGNFAGVVLGVMFLCMVSRPSLSTRSCCALSMQGAAGRRRACQAWYDASSSPSLVLRWLLRLSYLTSRIQPGAVLGALLSTTGTLSLLLLPLLLPCCFLQRSKLTAHTKKSKTCASCPVVWAHGVIW